MRHKPQDELSSVSSWLPFFSAMYLVRPGQVVYHTPHMYFTQIAFLNIFFQEFVETVKLSYAYAYAYTGKDKFW